MRSRRAQRCQTPLNRQSAGVQRCSQVPVAVAGVLCPGRRSKRRLPHPGLGLRRHARLGPKRHRYSRPQSDEPRFDRVGVRVVRAISVGVLVWVRRTRGCGWAVMYTVSVASRSRCADVAREGGRRDWAVSVAVGAGLESRRFALATRRQASSPSAPSGSSTRSSTKSATACTTSADGGRSLPATVSGPAGAPAPTATRWLSSRSPTLAP
jgi:hypothetical protein